MSHLPFMQFYPADWIQDTQTLTLEGQGAWIKIICAMWVAPQRGKLEWSFRQFATFLGQQRDKALALLEELSGVADLDLRDKNGKAAETHADIHTVTLMSRRIMREEHERIQARERQSKKRHGEVTEESRCIYQKSEVRSHIKKKIIHPILPPKWGDPEYLIDKYNREAPDSVSAVEKITPARIKKARDYLKIFPEESFWTEAFQEIGRSDFLQGLKSSSGHESFKANFDWLLTKGKDGTENIVKTFEGRYRNG